MTGMRPVHAVLFAILVAGFVGAPGAATAPKSEEISWSIRVAPDGEPGTRLTIRGIVFAPDGKAPAPGVTVTAYHTDAKGLYSMEGMDEANPRLKAVLVTGPQGQYEIVTILPGGYPDGKNPAHVHFQLHTAGMPDQVTTLYFEGDPLLPKGTVEAAATRGRFGNVVPLREARDGTLSCTFDMRLEKP